MRRIEQMAWHRLRGGGKSVERIDALGDLGDTAMAMRQPFFLASAWAAEAASLA